MGHIGDHYSKLSFICEQKTLKNKNNKKRVEYQIVLVPVSKKSQATSLILRDEHKLQRTAEDRLTRTSTAPAEHVERVMNHMPMRMTNKAARCSTQHDWATGRYKS